MDARTQRQHAKTFHNLHRKGEPLILFNAWDVATAKAIAKTSPAVATSSAAVASALSGRREEVFTLAFSDTVLVYRPERSDFRIGDMLPARLCVRLVGATVADIIQKGLRREKPILFRGAIAWGECLINPLEPRCFIGAPIIEAYRVEREQEWIGAVLAPSAAAVFGG